VREWTKLTKMLRATRNMAVRATRNSLVDLQLPWKASAQRRLKARTLVRKMMFSPLSSMQEA